MATTAAATTKMVMQQSGSSMLRAFRAVTVPRNVSMLLGVGASVGSSVSSVALCEESFVDKVLKKNRDGSMDWNATFDGLATEVGGQVQTAVDTGIPTQLSYGFVCGYCSGLALKKAGRAAAVVFGMGFVVLQGLASQGYIKVDHNKVKKDMESFMDQDNDGDFDQEDAKQISAKVLKMLQYNMPSGGGFAGGFVGGFRSG